MKKTIAMLTAGGDCPGINAVIRAVVKTAINDHGMDVVGIEDGFLGLIEGRWRQLGYEDVSGIITLGGTILGTSNKSDPFGYVVDRESAKAERVDVSDTVIKNFERIGASSLIAIGGDGTLSISEKLSQKGLPVIGIPKTIDNDVRCTDYTFGFDSAVATATDAIDKIHTTAQSHHRVMIIEVMGRYVGWLALCSGTAGGGDIILIPEITCDIDIVCKRLLERSRKGKRFTIVVVAEGAKELGGDLVVKRVVKDSHDRIRLGGIAEVLAAEVEERTGLETRVTVLGHLQRGGTPTAFDRVLATRFGREAATLAGEGREGIMVALKCGDIVTVAIKDAIADLKWVPRDHHLIATAESVGMSFGI
ncbi:MAG: ATP-dependent 6-phosphofructokinase [Candidatus Eisenbacteria bacterium]